MASFEDVKSRNDMPAASIGDTSCYEASYAGPATEFLLGASITAQHEHVPPHTPKLGAGQANERRV